MFHLQLKIESVCNTVLLPDQIAHVYLFIWTHNWKVSSNIGFNDLLTTLVLKTLHVGNKVVGTTSTITKGSLRPLESNGIIFLAQTTAIKLIIIKVFNKLTIIIID